MRKHFLLLFLLTLLPLAGFAADFKTEASATANDTYFGIAPTEQMVTVVVGSSTTLDPSDNLYEIDKTERKINYYTDANLNTKATVVDGTPVPGTYYLKINAKTQANTNYTYCTIRVKPRPLQVKITNGANQGSKTFNNKDNNDPDEVYGTITEISLGELATPVTYGTAMTSSSTGDALATFNALKNTMKVSRKAGKDAKAYDYEVSTTNTNYEILSVTGNKFTINAKTLPTTIGTTGNTYSLTITNNEKTYNGSKQSATIAIVDNSVGYTLVQKVEDVANDYTVKYGGTADAVTDANEAGYVISIEFTGNYQGSTAITLNGANDKKFIIKKQPLKVYVNEVTKVYDGTTTIPATTYGYSGLVGTDQGKAQPFGDIYETKYVTVLDNDGNKYVTPNGGYLLKPSQKSGTTPSGNYTNYKVELRETGLLVVKPRPLKITADDATKSFGASDPTFTFTLQTYDAVKKEGVVSGDETSINTAYKVVKNTTDETVGNKEGVLVPTLKAYNDFGSTTSAKDAVKKVLEQYVIDPVAGNFEITGATLTVYPEAQFVTYGDKYDLAKVKIIAVNNSGNRVDLTSKNTVKFKGEDQHPTARGIYTIVVDGDVTADGYTTIEKLESQFTINPKALTITPKAQTLHVGDTKAALALYNTNDSKVTFDGLVKGDVIKYELDFNTADDNTVAQGLIPSTFVDVEETTANTHNASLQGAVTEGGTVPADYEAKVGAAAAGTTLTAAEANAYNATLEGAYIAGSYTAGIDGEGKLTAAKTYAKGIKLTTDFNANDEDDMADFDNNNYEITMTATAALTVVAAATFILDDTDADLAAKIEAAHGTENVSFTFSSRELKAGQWNTLVLPFATTVKEVSEKLDYAVVDVLNKANTNESTVSLVLAFGVLPANEPFLVQPAENKNLNEVTFDNKTVVYSANPVVQDGGNHNFIGVYTMGKKVSSADKTEYYYNTTKKEFVNGGANGTAINPMRAYLKDNSANGVREFSIQEPNGETTVITNVNAEAEFNTNEAYDIRGMKMQSVPTQKGIYIINGKKVVIK